MKIQTKETTRPNARERIARIPETIRCSLNKLLDHVRWPDEERVENVLKASFGINESDKRYSQLKINLTNLIGRKIKENEFSEFFTVLSGQLSEKINMLLKKKEKRIESLNEEIINLRKQILKEIQRKEQIVEKIFSPKIFSIVDTLSYKILENLSSGPIDFKHLERISNITKKDMIWRINYFEELGILHSRHSKNTILYSLTDTGKKIFDKRGCEFERVINLLTDEVHQLSRTAVGGDIIMSERLKKWLESSKGRGHMTVIDKLNKRYRGDPKMVSQAFFGIKEMGATHEKHMKIKIFNHQASGELLIKFRNGHARVPNSHTRGGGSLRMEILDKTTGANQAMMREQGLINV